jgi:hypothetical protein
LNKVYLKTPSDVELHQIIVTYLRQQPDQYTHLWEYYGSQGALFNLLQRMLDAGEIVADHLKDGLITDDSMIILAETLQTKISSMPSSQPRPWLHRPSA